MAHDFRIFGQSVNGGLLSTLTSAITHTRADGTQTTAETAIREKADLKLTSDVWTSKGYTKGNYAIYNETLYECILTHASGIVPTNSTYWKATNVGAELSQVNSNYQYTENVSSLGSGKYSQSYTIPSDGTYLFVTRVRTFGGTGSYPTYICGRDVDKGESEDPSAGGLMTQYRWLDMTFIDKVTQGTHTRLFVVDDTTAPTLNIRTHLIKLR